MRSVLRGFSTASRCGLFVNGLWSGCGIETIPEVGSNPGAPTSSNTAFAVSFMQGRMVHEATWALPARRPAEMAVSGQPPLCHSTGPASHRDSAAVDMLHPGIASVPVVIFRGCRARAAPTQGRRECYDRPSCRALPGSSSHDDAQSSHSGAKPSTRTRPGRWQKTHANSLRAGSLRALSAVGLLFAASGRKLTRWPSSAAASSAEIAMVAIDCRDGPCRAATWMRAPSQTGWRGSPAWRLS